MWFISPTNYKFVGSPGLGVTRWLTHYVLSDMVGWQTWQKK